MKFHWRTLLPPERGWLILECALLGSALVASGAIVAARHVTEAAEIPLARTCVEFRELNAQEIAELSAAFPGEAASADNALVVLGSLASHAAGLGLSLADHSLTAVETRGHATVRPLTVDLSGPSGPLLRFLELVLRSELPVRLKSFQFDKGTNVEVRELKLKLEILLAGASA